MSHCLQGPNGHFGPQKTSCSCSAAPGKSWIPVLANLADLFAWHRPDDGETGRAEPWVVHWLWGRHCGQKPGLIQALCWSSAAPRCPGTSAWKWLNGKTPQRTLSSQKGVGGPTPSVSFTLSFSLLLYFSHPFDPKMGAGGVVGGELLC